MAFNWSGCVRTWRNKHVPNLEFLPINWIQALSVFSTIVLSLAYLGIPDTKVLIHFEDVGFGWIWHFLLSLRSNSGYPVDLEICRDAFHRGGSFCWRNRTKKNKHNFRKRMKQEGVLFFFGLQASHISKKSTIKIQVWIKMSTGWISMSSLSS